MLEYDFVNSAILQIVKFAYTVIAIELAEHVLQLLNPPL
jgi:hypothetical protein